MPTKRTVRTRNRRTGPLTPAEIQWLTGEPQADVNPFEWLEIDPPIRPDEFAKLESVLERGADLVSPERLAWLREQLELHRRRRHGPRATTD